MKKRKNGYDELQIKINTSIKLVIYTIITVIGSYFVWFHLVLDYKLSVNNSDWGQLGDFIGGVLNPLLALSAFYWLTQSVIVQKDELSDTRDILSIQSKTSEKKRFEDTFFAALDLHNELIKTINFKIVKNQLWDNASDTLKLDQEEYYNVHHESCGHYFRVLYELLKLISRNKKAFDLSTETIKRDRRSNGENFYAEIVRAFISSEIVIILAIICATNNRSEFYRLRVLVEKYALLENIPLPKSERGDAKIAQMLKLYDKKAFGRSLKKLTVIK